MILGMLAAAVFKLKGRAKTVVEIIVGAMEVGLLLTLGLAAYPAEAIAVKAFAISAKTVCHKKLKAIKVL
jgi:hypothetical protein